MLKNRMWIWTLIIVIVLISSALANIPCPSKTMLQYMTLSPNDKPLCGNGVLDEGEVCDDGNRLGGDGCNGWCSAFDRMTRACTLAGQNRECSRGTTLASSPSQTSFCSLSALAISPDGNYIVVADGATLVRMDLFTDSVLDNLHVLPATSSGSAEFGRFCSIFIVKGSSKKIVSPTSVLEGGGTNSEEEDIIIAHDCEKQNIVVFIYEGSSYVIKTPLPFIHLQNSNDNNNNNNIYQGKIYNKGFLDQESKQLVIAGLPQKKDGLRCVEVYAVDFTSSLFPVTLLGSIDCVVFNVVENGKKYPSFSMDGMVPYRVLRENCPFQMSALYCYAIYMERNDMQFAKAYISVDGGTDTEYEVSTDETVNVLGAPLISRSESSKITYTLTGNCFTASNSILSDLKMMPPQFALGYSCGPLPFGTGKCSTPLNNPFITDIVSSSYLLPNGLSSTHEHQELLDIFMQGNASSLLLTNSNNNITEDENNNNNNQKNAIITSSMILGGLPLYRQILDNAHKGTVPIDFQEIPHTQDVIYITETTIGMINSKGMMLMDLYNPGYCRPIKTILCPTGFFGSVGEVCKACDAESINSDSVSAQIQCSGTVMNDRRRRRRRNLLNSVFHSAPYTQISMVVSNKVQKNDIDILMKFYLIAHGYNCTEASAMSGYQPYNMAADMQDAGQNQQDGGKCTQLVPCIIESAGNKLKRNLSLDVPEEYLISWTLQNSSLVNALTRLRHREAGSSSLLFDKSQAAKCGLSGSTIDTLVQSKCMIWINSDFHIDWLPCALSVLNSSSSVSTVVTGNSNSRRRRHLLQSSILTVPANTNNMMIAVPHAQGTFVSTTTVSWGVLSKFRTTTSDSTTTRSDTNQSNDSNSGGNNALSNTFVIIIVSGILSGLLIAILLVVIFYFYFFKNNNLVNVATNYNNIMSRAAPPPQTSTSLFFSDNDYTNNNRFCRKHFVYEPLNQKSC